MSDIIRPELAREYCERARVNTFALLNSLITEAANQGSYFLILNVIDSALAHSEEAKMELCNRIKEAGYDVFVKKDYYDKDKIVGIKISWKLEDINSKEDSNADI